MGLARFATIAIHNHGGTSSFYKPCGTVLNSVGHECLQAENSTRLGVDLLLHRQNVCELLTFSTFFTILNAGSCSPYHIDLQCLNTLFKMGARRREAVSC